MSGPFELSIESSGLFVSGQDYLNPSTFFNFVTVDFGVA
jgi:hypothetical protein